MILEADRIFVIPAELDSKAVKSTLTEIVMVTDGEGIPLAFTMLPGSIADPTVPDETVGKLRDLGCYGRLVMGRGFESAENINGLLERGPEFTVPSNTRAEQTKKLMSSAITDMKRLGAHRYHEGRAYKTAEYDLGIFQDEMILTDTSSASLGTIRARRRTTNCSPDRANRGRSRYTT